MAPLPSVGKYSRTDSDGFPQFALLPPELRRRILELYCAGVASKILIFEMLVFNFDLPDHEPCVRLCDSQGLRDATSDLRAALSINTICRETVMAELPDTFAFRSRNNPQVEGLLHFKKERDLISVRGFTTLTDEVHSWHSDESGEETSNQDYKNYELPRFKDIVQNVIIEQRSIYTLTGFEKNYCLQFVLGLKNLKAAFYRERVGRNRRRRLAIFKWLSSHACHRQRESIGTEALIYCWPDPYEEPDNAPDMQVIRRNMRLKKTAKMFRYILVPMVVFEGQFGGNLYEEFLGKAWEDIENEDSEDAREELSFDSDTSLSDLSSNHSVSSAHDSDEG